MSFIWPQALLLVLAVPLGVLGYRVLDRRRRRRIAAYGAINLGPGVAQSAQTPGGRLRRRLPVAFTLLGLTVIVVALARPQSVVSVPRIEGTVILAFDVSGSMAATDVQPTRMEAAKAAARAFVHDQPSSVLIGVVAFSDSGFSIQVPTNDPVAIEAAIDRLAPQRGTSLARGISSSLTTIETAEADPTAGFYSNKSPAPTPEPTPVPAGTHTSAVIVLLSDGENNQQPDPLTAAQAAADRGVRIDTIGVGTAAGSTLDIEGFKVHSQLEDSTLRQISALTDGTYYAAADEAQLHAIYDTIDTRLVVKPEAIEVTSLFAGAGVLLLLIGGTASLLWLGRLP